VVRRYDGGNMEMLFDDMGSKAFDQDSNRTRLATTGLMVMAERVGFELSRLIESMQVTDFRLGWQRYDGNNRPSRVQFRYT